MRIGVGMLEWVAVLRTEMVGVVFGVYRWMVRGF